MPTPADIHAIQIAIQARIPTFLWGPPGCGKTSILEQLAPALGEKLWTVILSIREPSDQGGLPVVSNEGVRMHPPMWAQQLCAEGHGIVFWDEFNTAPPTTQSSALRVVHGGWAGDLKLPDHTSHVAAGNPPEVSTGAYDLTSAIANRWCHFRWSVDAPGWSDGMVAGWPKPAILKLPENWRSHIAAKRGIVASFIRRRGELLLQLPEETSEQGRAWPSPRTWEMAALLLAAAAAVGQNEKSEVARLLVQGAVGESAAREFTSWYVNLDLRDPEEYLRDPKGTPLPKRQDQIMATLDSVAGSALDQRHKKKDQVERYYAAWKVIGRVCREAGPDISMPAARTLATNMPPEVDKKIPPEIEDILPMLEKANIDFSAQR